MTSGIRVAMASIAASFVVLFASTWAPAHEAHKKQAQAAASEVSRREPAAPAAASYPETKMHEHVGHDSIPGPNAGDTQPAASVSNVPAPLAWLGKFHPLVTHFPIALILSAAVAELLYLRRGTALFDHAVRFSIWLGAGGALAAALLGWFFAGFHFVDDEWIMTAHRWMGTTTALWAAGLLYLSERAASGAASRKSFRIVLFTGAALVAATGFLGGALIYGLDHYAWGVS